MHAHIYSNTPKKNACFSLLVILKCLLLFHILNNMSRGTAVTQYFYYCFRHRIFFYEKSSFFRFMKKHTYYFRTLVIVKTFFLKLLNKAFNYKIVRAIFILALFITQSMCVLTKGRNTGLQTR